MSVWEQYINHVRAWTSKYHLSFEEIERMPLGVLFDLEVVDSKIEAAFEEKRGNSKGSKGKPFCHPKRTIDQIMNF